MSFIRPEARAAIWRWRELIAGLGTATLGVWWVLTSHGLLPWIGGALALLGASLAIAGSQRGRFRGPTGGPGIVRVREGQVAYFGPLSGGVVALSEISRITYLKDARPAHWVIAQPGQDDLQIPMNAEGVDALFDAFTSLPGLMTERMLSAQRNPTQERVVIWERNSAKREHDRISSPSRLIDSSEE